jgi:hypothetical protein
MSHFYVRHYNQRPLFDLIMKTLTEAGYSPRYYPEAYWNPGVNDDAVSYCLKRKDCGYSGGGLGWYEQRKDEFKQVTLDEFFLQVAKPTITSVKLNEKYVAQVMKDGTVKVGCQAFSVKEAQAIIDAHKELNA